MIGHTQLIRDFEELVDEDRLAHGYIFFGPHRAGKGTFARAFANYLETHAFETPHESKVLGDLLVLAPARDEPTVGIDRIREAKTFLAQAPNRSKRRTLIIDGAEHLTGEAENALLKTTEEPYPRALIILVIDDPERLLPTLRSRLQKVFFGAVSEAEIQAWLIKEHGVKTVEAKRLAARSHGLPGLAWAFAHDTQFQAMQAAAKRFAAERGFARNAFVKALVEDEAFQFNEFLEALAILLFPDADSAKKHRMLWHRIAELRRNADSFNLNPRLQLTALAQCL